MRLVTQTRRSARLPSEFRKKYEFGQKRPNSWPGSSTGRTAEPRGSRVPQPLPRLATSERRLSRTAHGGPCRSTMHAHAALAASGGTIPRVGRTPHPARPPVQPSARAPRGQEGSPRTRSRDASPPEPSRRCSGCAAPAGQAVGARWSGWPCRGRESAGGSSVLL